MVGECSYLSQPVLAAWVPGKQPGWQPAIPAGAAVAKTLQFKYHFLIFAYGGHWQHRVQPLCMCHHRDWHERFCCMHVPHVLGNRLACSAACRIAFSVPNVNKRCAAASARRSTTTAVAVYVQSRPFHGLDCSDRHTTGTLHGEASCPCVP
jgi:hypothetical protein